MKGLSSTKSLSFPSDSCPSLVQSICFDMSRLSAVQIGSLEGGRSHSAQNHVCTITLEEERRVRLYNTTKQGPGS